MADKNSSVSYYDQHAAEFIENTLTVDMASLYQRFLPLLASTAHILDAGCGSGRDSKYFIEQGFQVTAIDASAALAQSASLLIGQDVEHCYFQDFSPSKPFDAIWACASLLHVASAELPDVFNKLSTHLVRGGLFYCSFKYGNDDVERNGRYFTNADEKRIKLFIADSSLTIQSSWITGDLRQGRDSEQWLNLILVKNKE